MTEQDARLDTLERALRENTQLLRQLLPLVRELTGQRERTTGTGSARPPAPIPVVLHVPDAAERERVHALNAAAREARRADLK